MKEDPEGVEVDEDEEAWGCGAGVPDDDRACCGVDARCASVRG